LAYGEENTSTSTFTSVITGDEEEGGTTAHGWCPRETGAFICNVGDSAGGYAEGISARDDTEELRGSKNLYWRHIGSKWASLTLLRWLGPTTSARGSTGLTGFGGRC
jgi:hypothetical protein